MDDLPELTQVPAVAGPGCADTPGQRRGRPRSPEAEAAIIDATLEMIADHGLTGLSVESVAAQAGVGKATIYRRWASKEALVCDALARLAEDVPAVPERATTRETLIEILEQIRCKSAESRTGRIMPRMLSHSATQPELFKLYFDQVMRPRRDRVRRVIEAGIASGELRTIDIELAVTLFTAPMLYLNLMQAGLGRPPEGTSAAIVDAVLSGLAGPAS